MLDTIAPRDRTFAIAARDSSTIYTPYVSPNASESKCLRVIDCFTCSPVISGSQKVDSSNTPTPSPSQPVGIPFCRASRYPQLAPPHQQLPQDL